MIQGRNDNLGYLGEPFQYKLAHEFMDNHSFFEDLSPIIDQNMFTDPNLKTFVGIMKNYYDKQGSVPSYDYMGIELRRYAHSEKESEMYMAVLNQIRDTSSDGVERTRELAEKFFRQQNIIKTAHEILRIAGNGEDDKYDACVGLLNDALTKGTKNDFGEGLFDHINDTLSDDYRTPIPTGIEKIDEILEGGLGKGELGVIIGPTSFGKALSNSELVATPTGFVCVKDIKIGDYLIGSNGKKTKVVGVFPQGIRKIYKVAFSDGTSYECDIDHILPVNSHYQRTRKDAPDMSFTNLTLREIMERGLYISGHVHNFAVPICKPVEFEEISIDEDPHDIGAKKDRESIPEEYLMNSIENRWKLLIGMMDAHGIVKRSGHPSFETIHKGLAEQFAELVRSLGGVALVAKKETDDSKYEVTYDIFEHRRIITRESKQRRVKYIDEDKFYKYIVSITYTHDEDATCFLVDAEDHLFLTRNYNVTHNTSLTTAMASNAAEHDFKVLQIVFEDRIKQIQRKHFGRITGIEAKDLSKPELVDKVKDMIEHYEFKDKLKTNLRIVKFPSGEKTARQIERYIKKQINAGFKPDLVIVDYFECLDHEADRNVMNEYEREGKTMRRFEAMAGELDIAIWIPSQGTKDSINLELVTMDKMGGSVKKAQIAHVIMSIARTVDDIANNKATIAILKNRAGNSGKVLNNVDFNNGTCRINTSNADELDSMFEYKQKKNDDLIDLQRDIFKSTKES